MDGALTDRLLGGLTNPSPGTRSMIGTTLRTLGAATIAGSTGRPAAALAAAASSQRQAAHQQALNQQAAMREQLQSELAGIDPRTHEGMTKAFGVFMKHGMFGQAQQVLQIREMASQSPESLKPVALGENQRLVDPNTGEIIRDVAEGAGVDDDAWETRQLSTGEFARFNKATGAWQPYEGTPSEPIVPEEQDFGPASDLRKEFRGSSKEFLKQRAAYGRLNSSYRIAEERSQKGMPGGFSDMSMIFQYMKILDPESTVREGEYASAKNAGSVPTKVRNMYNQAISGDFLTPEQRSEMIQQSDGIMRSALGIQTDLMGRYSSLSKMYEVPDPRMVVVDYRTGLEHLMPDRADPVEVPGDTAAATPAQPWEPPQAVQSEFSEVKLKEAKDGYENLQPGEQVYVDSQVPKTGQKTQGTPAERADQVMPPDELMPFLKEHPDYTYLSPLGDGRHKVQHNPTGRIRTIRPKQGM